MGEVWKAHDGRLESHRRRQDAARRRARAVPWGGEYLASEYLAASRAKV